MLRNTRIKIEITQLEDGTFIVNNQAAKTVCPYCGSTNTAPILYGFPAFSPQMLKKLDAGRLQLGGCELWAGRPDRHCNDCEKGFMTSPMLYDIPNEFTFDIIHDDFRNTILFAENPESAEGIILSYEKFGEMSVRIATSKTDSGIVFKKERGAYKYQVPDISNDKEISSLEWDSLLKFLYDDCKFNKWKSEYKNTHVLDGIRWKITVFFPGMKKQESQGINSFPEKFGIFMSQFYNIDEPENPGFQPDLGIMPS